MLMRCTWKHFSWSWRN